MDRVTIIGTFAAICTTVSFLPQVIKIIRTRHTSDLSLPMYIIFMIGILSWFYYGIMTDSMPIIAANAVTAVFCAYIILMKLKYK